MNLTPVTAMFFRDFYCLQGNLKSMIYDLKSIY